MPNKLIPLPFDGGINLLVDRKRIADNECVRTKNLIPVQPGILGKRAAMTLDRELGSAPFGTPMTMAMAPFLGADIRGAWTTKDTDANSTILSVMTPTLLYTSLSIGDATLSYPSFSSWGRILYCYPGYGGSAAAYSLDMDALDATNAFKTWAFGGSGNTGLRPKMAAAYNGRMVYANFGPGYTSALIWADPFAPETIGDDALAANGWYVTIGDEGGDEIVAIIPITQTAVANPTQEALLVLKQYSGYIITGEPLVSTATPDADTGILGSLIINRISFDVGCASLQTVVRTP